MIRKISWLGWLPSWSVGMVVFAVYAAWCAAFFQLGRRPMPSMDDPKYIGGMSTAVFQAMGLLILASLVVWLLGMIATVVVSVLPRNEERMRWLMKAGVGVLASAGLFLMIRHSPGDAFSWFMD